MRYLLLALLFAVPVVHAQVVTCSDAVTGQPYTACTHLGNSTTVPPPGLVLFCSGAVGGAATPGTTLAGCAIQQWQPTSYMQSYSWTWTLQGWQRYGSMVFTTAPAPVPTPTWTGVSTLNWVPPTQYIDGSALVDLAGYRIRYGTSPTALTQMIQVAGAGVTSYVVPNLAAGTWYFTVSSYTNAGVESDPSNVASVTLTAPAPTPVVTWAVAANGTQATRPVYEAVLDAAGTATVRGNVEGTVKIGAPCLAEAFKISTNSYREIAESDVTLASPTYRGRRHTALCSQK